MYFSKNSGIKLLDSTNTFNGSSFIRVPINESNSAAYYLSVLQFAFRSDFTFVNSTVYDIIRMVLPASVNYDIYATGQSNGTANIAIDNIANNTVTVLVNGKSSATIKPFEWNIVTIGFLEPLNFGNTNPAIETGLRLVNNFSYEGISTYQIPEEKLNRQLFFDQWNEYDTETTWDGTVPGSGGLDDIWYNINFDLSVAVGNISIDPTKTYFDYIGALRISNGPDFRVLSFPGTKWTSYTAYNQVSLTQIPL